eukprot:12815182-Ditylum_brightwellii.AAC.1
MGDMFTTMVTKSNNTYNSVTAIVHMINKQQEQCGVMNQTKQQFNLQQMNNIHVPNLPIAYLYYQAQQLVTQEQYNTTMYDQRIGGSNYQMVNTANSNVGSPVPHAKAVSNKGA